MATFIEITTRPLDVEAIVRSVTAASTGAVSAFVGTTRDHFDGRRVLRLEYEAYEPMARKELAKVCERARERWNVHHVAVHHRLGVVGVTEASVVIAISSEHRKESLEAVAFVIDELKATAPIWKKEIYDEGEDSWKENKECTWTAAALAPIEVDSSEIQINAPRAELERRMEAFMRRKRQELDSSNVLEFCNRHVSDPSEFSCARTDSVLVQRQSGQHSHLRQSNVVNPYGPQTREACPDTPTPTPLSEAVRERLTALESRVLAPSHPRDEEQRPVATDVYARLRALEDRVSFLEGLSPEYVTRTGGGAGPHVTDDDSVTTSIAGINSRIQELQAALTTKHMAANAT